jgi:phosphoglycolate phosphatase-like HAD superfamily hydrolase
MACVTNKPAAFTGRCWSAPGIAVLCVTVSGDTLAEKKPHPAPCSTPANASAWRRTRR